MFRRFPRFLTCLVLLSLAWPMSASAQCTADKDCKGNRICEKGACVDPPANTCTKDVDCSGDLVCQGGKCEKAAPPVPAPPSTVPAPNVTTPTVPGPTATPPTGSATGEKPPEPLAPRKVEAESDTLRITLLPPGPMSPTPKVNTHSLRLMFASAPFLSAGLVMMLFGMGGLITSEGASDGDLNLLMIGGATTLVGSGLMIAGGMTQPVFNTQARMFTPVFRF